MCKIYEDIEAYRILVELIIETTINEHIEEYAKKPKVYLVAALMNDYNTFVKNIAERLEGTNMLITSIEKIVWTIFEEKIQLIGKIL